MTATEFFEPRVGVFHPGTQHSWQTALAFQESGQLGWYATSVFYDPNRWPYRLERYLPRFLSDPVGREFRRRYTPLLDLQKIRQFGFHEWLETFSRRLGVNRLAKNINNLGNRVFGKQVIDLIKREPVDTVWGFNGASLEVFRWAKQRGLRCILDQTTGHPAEMNKLMAEEYARNPDFKPGFYTFFSPEVLARQDEEAELADIVVCGSDFCAQTMIKNGCDKSKIHVVPYGYDESLFPLVRPEREPLQGRPVRFLFVGRIEALKGAAYILPAFSSIPRDVATLTLVGKNMLPKDTFARYADHVVHVDNVPRSEVVHYYQAADCFIFPSLFEGGGIVLYEAVGAGLGIIQSSYCGNVICDASNGVMLKKISQNILYEAIMDIVQNTDRLEKWQNESWKMRKDMQWSCYREKIRELAAYD